MSVEIDGTVYSDDYEQLHGRKPGEPAPEPPAAAERPAAETVYATDYEAIHGRKPGEPAVVTEPPAAPAQQPETKVVAPPAAEAPAAKTTAETA